MYVVDNLREDTADRQPLGKPEVKPKTLNHTSHREPLVELENTTLMSELRQVSLPHPSVGDNPDIRTDTRLIPLQRWEGFVEEVDHDNQVFSARLYDLERGADAEQEYVELLLSDIDDDDLELVKPGGVFRWIIGYRDKAHGSRKRESGIVFRRLPTWTNDDLELANKKGKEIADALQWE